MTSGGIKFTNFSENRLTNTASKVRLNLGGPSHNLEGPVPHPPIPARNRHWHCVCSSCQRERQCADTTGTVPVRQCADTTGTVPVRQCADTTGTVPVPSAGHVQCPRQKYKNIFQVKYTEAIFSNSARKLSI